MAEAPDETQIRVRDAMGPAPHFFAEGDLLADAVKQLTALPIGAVPVVASDGSVKGLLVNRDGIAALKQGDSASVTVGEVYRPGIAIGVEESLAAARRVLERERVARVPVVDGHRLVGEISRAHIRDFVEKQQRMLRLPPHERSRVRWRGTEPTTGLTWAMQLSGEAFVAKAESYGAFGPDKVILEIGPGYGRLLRECLQRELPFRNYVALDISPANVDYLSKEFERTDVDVVNGDVETVSLDQRFDTVLSSLTLKHLYPTFEAALHTVERHLNPAALVMFDLIEGGSAGFWGTDTVTYLRSYSRADVEAILTSIPLELAAFDQVDHAPGQERLLVVARKGG